MRTSDGGFTLFEVLGAVAILAILYTTLSTVAIRGLRSEGESRRLLEASLLADWELSEFELLLDAGAAPEIGTIQSEDESGFTVTWDVTPFEAPLFADASTREEAKRALNQGVQYPPPPTATAARSAGEAAPFLKVELRVSWFDAGQERWVTRTIFAVDEDAASAFATATAQSDAGVEGEPPP